MATSERLELPTPWFEAKCSIQLSYEATGADSKLLRCTGLGTSRFASTHSASVMLAERGNALADGPYWKVFQCSIRPGPEREQQTCSVSSAIVLVPLLGLLSR